MLSNGLNAHSFTKQNSNFSCIYWYSGTLPNFAQRIENMNAHRRNLQAKVGKENKYGIEVRRKRQ